MSQLLYNYMIFSFTLSPSVSLVVLSLCRPKILSCLLKLWSHFPTHIRPLTLSMLLFIFPCLSLSYSPSSFPLQPSPCNSSVTYLCRNKSRWESPLSLCRACSISVPLAFSCRPSAGGLEAFNEICGEITPHQTHVYTLTMHTHTHTCHVAI